MGVQVCRHPHMCVAQCGNMFLLALWKKAFVYCSARLSGRTSYHLDVHVHVAQLYEQTYLPTYYPPPPRPPQRVYLPTYQPNLPTLSTYLLTYRPACIHTLHDIRCLCMDGVLRSRDRLNKGIQRRRWWTILVRIASFWASLRPMRLQQDTCSSSEPQTAELNFRAVSADRNCFALLSLHTL